MVEWSFKNGSMLITFDGDFARLAHTLGKAVGVILIVTHPPTSEKVKHLLSFSFSKIRIDKHTKELVVITETAIRIGVRSSNIDY